MNFTNGVRTNDGNASRPSNPIHSDANAQELTPTLFFRCREKSEGE